MSVVRTADRRVTGAPAPARRTTWPPWVRDVLIVVLAWTLDLALFSRVTDTTPAETVGAVAVTALGAVALMWRRRYPVHVFGFLLLHSVVVQQFPPLTVEPAAALLAALYAVASRCDRAVAVAATLTAFVPEGISTATGVRTAKRADRVSTLVVDLIAFPLMTGGAWAVGRWARRNTDQLQAARHQSELAARRAVALERARIARELHDIVAHSVTVMVLQTAGARRLVTTEPDRAARALVAVEEAGGHAMNAMRQLLTVLRADKPEAAGSPSGEDQPGLADIPSLLDGVRATGVEVRLHAVGPAGHLDASLALAAYRVIQEGLTNVTKHAGPGSAATITMTWKPEALVVQVADTGPAPTGRRHELPGGHGLLGLHERISLLGGQLTAGPAAAGGFTLTAVIPRANRAGSAARTGTGPDTERGAGPAGAATDAGTFTDTDTTDGDTSSARR